MQTDYWDLPETNTQPPESNDKQLSEIEYEKHDDFWLMLDKDNKPKLIYQEREPECMISHSLAVYLHKYNITLPTTNKKIRERLGFVYWWIFKKNLLSELDGTTQALMANVYFSSHCSLLLTRLLDKTDRPNFILDLINILFFSGK